MVAGTVTPCKTLAAGLHMSAKQRLEKEVLTQVEEQKIVEKPENKTTEAKQDKWDHEEV